MRVLIATIAVIFAVASTTGCSRDVSPAPTRSYSRTILAVEHLGQEPMLCVPTSAAMVLAFYGDPRPPRLLKSLAAGWPYDATAPFTDFTITLYDDLIKAVNGLGYDWAQHTFANDDVGFASGLLLIENEIRDGHPVLVDATLPSGHTFVVRGFDADAHKLYAVDPNEPAPGQREITFSEFKSVWNETAYGHDIRAMIVTAPAAGKTTAS